MSRPTIVVVGLGYVGLPLAVALAKQFECYGLDINEKRIAELRAGYDRTDEIDSDKMSTSSLKLTANPADCPAADFYIVTVPTPVDSENRPDLSIVEAATRTVGRMIKQDRGPIIVYESTVYPGVTEDLCAPVLEDVSGLKCGEDFFLGYSPERINPGDREHTIDRITKVVAGQNSEVADKIGKLYASITTGGVFKAASIKAAEAAKVIENAQRDINIAFMNEIAQIFARMEISVWDVLAAARTKWNFLPFSPGLVGGHCIGVDPYYLSHRAEQLGYDPKVILSGRDTNDAMAKWVADAIDAKVKASSPRTLILGLTFKEDVPDLRNSKVADLIARLKELGHRTVVHDPHADEEEARHEYGISLDARALDSQYDAVILAVPHHDYREMGSERLAGLAREGGVFADLKACFPREAVREDLTYWSL